VAHLFDDDFDDSWRHERFIVTIQQKTGISWSEAERAAQAVLQTLGERIAWGEARDLAADLPQELRPWLLDPGGDAEPFDAREFIRRVAEREGVDAETAEEHARAVFVALARLVRGNEIEDLVDQLSKDYEPIVGQARQRRRDPGAPDPMPVESFLRRVADRAGIDLDAAQRATEAVLETLAERIAAGEAEDIAAQLPPELRAPLERGEAASDGKAQRMSLDEFAARIAQREGDIDFEDALGHARAVVATLREALPPSELSDLLAQLPRGYVEALL
jgi:uncharacterized protein (DUF2267 family)